MALTVKMKRKAASSFSIIFVVLSSSCREAPGFTSQIHHHHQFSFPSSTTTPSTPSHTISQSIIGHLHECTVHNRRTSRTALNAKKTSTKKKATTSVMGGAGFGTKTVAVDKQVRSVSGHRGSGEKPLRQAANTFDAIRKDHGAECTNDVYCRSPLNDKETFWFVGKIAVRPNTAATPKQAVLSQKRLILEYSKRELRPQNLGGKYSDNLELWIAPGDSEMDAVQNKISLVRVDGSTADLVPDFSVKDVGYNPEIYVGDEREKGGLRIKRDDEGRPIKPVFDVNQSI